jgi:tetratricopeptide (TPR) repeat protein
MIRRAMVAATLLAVVAVTAAAERRLHSSTAVSPAGKHLLYLPSGKYLRALAPGHREVLADLIYLWSIQFYSDYDRDERYTYLEHIFANVITELDPRYQDPYLIGALIMVLEASEMEMALRLLDKGIEANPESWLLPFEAGFYCYDMLHDYKRAARYFERSMKAPGAHPLVRRLHAEMFNKAGDRRTSLRYWQQIYDTAEDEYVRTVSFRHVHDLKLHVDLDLLTEAIRIHQEIHGVYPRSLQALVAAEIIGRVPKQPGGEPYIYNRHTGQVRASERFLLLRRAR